MQRKPESLYQKWSITEDASQDAVNKRYLEKIESLVYPYKFNADSTDSKIAEFLNLSDEGAKKFEINTYQLSSMKYKLRNLKEDYEILADPEKRKAYEVEFKKLNAVHAQNWLKSLGNTLIFGSI